MECDVDRIPDNPRDHGDDRVESLDMPDTDRQPFRYQPDQILAFT